MFMCITVVRDFCEQNATPILATIAGVAISLQLASSKGKTKSLPDVNIDEDQLNRADDQPNGSTIMIPLVHLPQNDLLIPKTTTSTIMHNFVVMSILFSANYGCVVACLSFATARLGSIGAYQSGLLYVFTKLLYSCNYVVKKLIFTNVCCLVLYTIWFPCTDLLRVTQHVHARV
jgi:hypothetical protein